MKSMPFSIEVLLALMYATYSGFTLSLRSLLPSYAVMEGITTAGTAAFCVSIYSLFMTFFRFVFVFIKTDSMKMLRAEQWVAIGTIFLCLLAHYAGYGLFVVFGSSIMLGVAFSSYYPLMVSVPSYYNYEVTMQNSSNFMLGYSIGEAGLSAVVGYCMDLFYPIFLFYAMLAMGIALKVGLEITVLKMEKESEYHSIELSD